MFLTAHIETKREIVKNGNSELTLVWEIDHSRPKICVEDNYYKFNKTLVRAVSKYVKPPVSQSTYK